MQFVEPIRNVKQIEAMKKLLKTQRDRLLFVMGINTALRVSDLLNLTIKDVLDDKGRVRDDIAVKEKKTRKNKAFPLNASTKKELKAYLAERGRADADEALFISHRGAKPLDRQRAWAILNEVGQQVGLCHIGTHTLRKTFGYHVYKNSGGNLGLVQKLLNHSSSGDTLRYIGIDREQMDNAYLELNL